MIIEINIQTKWEEIYNDYSTVADYQLILLSTSLITNINC